MANMDSISIELTADVSSAESSINKLIGTLNRLKSAITGASSFEKVTRGIAGIAAVASGIDSNAGKKLSDLAAGIDALSKAGDVSHLKGAAKIISDLNNAMNGSGSASGLANGIREASNALGSINQADVDKLTAVRDALSGEVSGAMHQSASNENAMLGGMENASLVPLQEIEDGFNYIEGQIVAATDAYYDFRNALTGGVNWTYGGGNNNGTWYADGVRDPSRSWANIFDSFPRALPGQVGTIETEFVNLSDTSEVAAGSVIRLRGALASIGGYIANDIKTVFSNIGGAIKGFASSVLRIARYRIIRAMLKNISQGFTEGRENLYKWSAAMNGHYAKSMNNLATSTLYMKNALGTLVGPLMESLAPALNWIIDRLVEAINYFNMFVAAISGKSTYTAAVKSATTWGKAVSNAAGNAKDKVDELKRTIMGFDEINKLDKISEGSGGTGGTGGSGGGGVAGMFEERELTGGFQEFSNAFESALQDTLSRITLMISGAELAVGAILALTGANVPLGLGLMAAGAVGLASAIVANWSTISAEVKRAIAAIEAVVSGGLAVGAVLAFSGGNIRLGIGLMAGALATGSGAITLAWNSISGKVGDEIAAITAVVGGALLGVGAILALSSANIPLGIGLMAAGAVSLGTAAVITWTALKTQLAGYIEQYGLVVSGSLLAVGALIALTGANIPLGIGIMAVGATGLAASVAITWTTLKTQLSGYIEQYGLVVSGALLAVGALIALTGANIPLGIGIMAVGAAGLASTVAITWTTLKTQLAGYIEQYGLVVSGALLAVGALLALTGANIPLGIGILAVGAAGLAATVSITWTTLKTQLSGYIEQYGAVVGGALLAVGGLLALTGVNIPLGLGILALGAASLAASAAVKWTTLKTQLDGYLELYGGAVSGALLAVGALLALTGVNIPLGLAAMAAGAATLVTSSSVTWTTLKTQLSGYIDQYGSVVGGSLLAVGGLLALTGVNIPLGLAVLAAGATTLAASASVKWTTLKTQLDGYIGQYALVVSGASLAIGALLALSGVNIPLGLALLATGAWGVVGSVDWDWIGQTLQDKLDILKQKYQDFKDWVDKLWESLFGANDDNPPDFTPVENNFNSGYTADGLPIENPVPIPVVPEIDQEYWDAYFDDYFDHPFEIPTTLTAAQTVAKVFKDAWNKLSAENKTVQVVGNLVKKVNQTFGSVFGTTMDVVGKLVPIKGFSLGGVFGTALTVLGSLTKKDTDQTPGKVFDVSTALNYVSTLARKANAKKPSEVWNAGASVGNYVSTLAREKGAKRPSEVWNAGASVGSYISTLVREKGAKSPAKVWNAGASVGDYVSTLAREKGAKTPKEVWNGGAVIDYFANLKKSWKGTWKSALGIPSNPKMEIQAQFKKNKNKDEVEITSGGVSVGTMKLSLTALGGIFSNGIWKSIPQYAGGTTNAHGSLFLAGEAGPEIVGHVGGRTEVLNRSQLAATMYSAVNAAMSGVTLDANFGGGSVDSYETMYEAVYDAVTAAMSKSDDRDREKIALLRQLNQKEFSANISTGQINQAQRYANRRAGTTIVPVGT